MANTPNYNLYKPSRSDSNVEVDTSLTNNFTIIDTELKNNKDGLDTHKSDPNAHTSDKIAHADGSVKTMLDNHEAQLADLQTETTSLDGRVTDIETLGLEVLAPNLEGRIQTIESDVEGFLAPATFDSMDQQGYTFDEYRLGYVENRVGPLETSLAEIATNVKKYGAIGDGVTDCSIAFQSANDYLAANGGGRLLVPAGTFLANFILDCNVYIEGVGLKPSIIKSVPNSNKDVIQGRDFLSLTGTAKQTPENRGVRYSGIKNILVDGNKQNNTAGYGIRLWGCSWNWDNVIVQNCANDGIYTEFTTHDSPVGLDDPSIQSLESYYTNIRTINNNGNGWTYKGPHDSSIINLNTFGNGGWGLYQESGGLTGYLWNSWLNNLGSFYIGTSLHCYKMQATGPNTGVGVEISAAAGNVELTDLYANGHSTGVIVRGSNIRISGNILNIKNADNTAGDGVIIDGASTYSLNLTGSGNFNVFKYIGSNGRNIIIGNFLIPSGKTLYAGASIGRSNDYIDLIGVGDTNVEYFQLPTRNIKVAGWTPVMPQSNGTIITDSTAPTTTLRGGVLKQPAIADLTAAPTMSDFNNLLSKLKAAGVLT